MDKHNNISEFDNLFKQSFEGASNAVPPGVWEGISAATSGVGAAAGSSILSKLIGIKGAAIIGSVAVIVTTTVLLTANLDESNEAGNTQVSVEQSVVENSNNQDEVIASDIKNIDSKEANEGARSEIIANKDVDVNHGSTIQSDNAVQNDEPINQLTSPDEVTPNTNNKTTNLIKPTGTIITATETACVNQKVDFTLHSSSVLKSYRWTLNGKAAPTSRQFMSFLFDQPGKQVITVVAETEDGQKLEVSKTIQVENASADFKVSQQDGNFNLIAIKPLKENQWFANQMLIKENQPSIQYEPTTEQTVFVHMVTDLNGCKDTARQTVVRKADCHVDLKIFDVISPYFADGVNDDFNIELPKAEGYRLTIYNYKDGKVVFDSDDQNEKWNGRFENTGALVPGGNYLYKLVYNCDGKEKTVPGKVTVIESKN